MRGYAEAQKKLGDCYTHGTGVAKDLEQAFECYSKAAKQGNARAQNNLGVCYTNGEGVVEDPAQAAEWYKRAASKGLHRRNVILATAINMEKA